MNSFPNPRLTPIDSRPDYAAIAKLNLQLNANAASVPSARGDGRHGLLALTVSPQVYLTTTGMNFVPPTNPGVHPVGIPATATNVQIAYAQRQHEADIKEWQQWVKTDQALKNQLIAAVPSIYLSTLRSALTEYSNVTTRQMLEHLYRVYGKITPAQMAENDKKMRAPFDPNQPFENFVQQIEEGMILAEAGKAEYTQNQIVLIAYNIFDQTGVFSDECKEWRKLPPARHTWAEFKTLFGEAHADLFANPTTAQAAGYNNRANNVHDTDMHQQTAQALNDLEAATTADRTTVQELAAANTNLTNQLTTVTTALNKALAELSLLRTQLPHMQQAQSPVVPTTTTNSTSTHPRNRPKRTVRRFNNTNYCWSCGWDVHDWHTSATCNPSWRKPGHENHLNATREDTQGGSDRHKHLVM